MKSAIYYLGDFDPVTAKDFALCESLASSKGAKIVFLPSPEGLLSSCEASSRQREEMLSLSLSSIKNPLLSADFSLLDLKDASEVLRCLNSINEGGDAAFLLRDEDKRTLMNKGFGDILDKTEVLLASVYEDEFSLPSSASVRNLADPCLEPSIRPYIEKERLYYVARLASFLKSEHRLQHSLSVGNLAFEIAKANKLPNPIKAYVAGVFHDLGKHCPREQEKAIIGEFFAPYADFPQWAFHEFTGAYLAEKEFGIDSLETLDAIKSHATGKANMSALGKIIYSADKIDPLRGYDSSWMIKECMKNYGTGFLTVLRENRDYLTKKGYRVDNPLTKECFEMYLEN